MAGTLTESTTFDATVPKISNGEDIDETLLNQAPQTLGNRTQWLKSRIGGLVDVLQFINQTASLTANDINKFILLGGSSNTITLPAADASVPNGSGFVFSSQGGATTINRSSSDVISIGSVTNKTTFQMTGSDYVRLVKYSTGIWVASEGTPVLQNSGTGGVFGATKNGYGWQKLPSGVILQWGYQMEGAVVFPIAFPTACTAAVPIGIGSNNATWLLSAPTTTGFTAYVGPADAGSPMMWIAIGY